MQDLHAVNALQAATSASKQILSPTLASVLHARGGTKLFPSSTHIVQGRK